MMASRRTYKTPTAEQAEVTGILPEMVSDLLRRQRGGESLTLWLDSVADDGHLVRVTRITRGASWVVDVLSGGTLRSVGKATRLAANCDIVVAPPAAIITRGTLGVRLSTMLNPDDAAHVAFVWLRHGELSREWALTSLV